MIITKQELAIHLLNYLQHKSSLTELVQWAENAFMEGEIEGEDPDIIRDVLARLGLSDVKAFGLFWEDCNEYMNKLGYRLHIDANLVA